MTTASHWELRRRPQGTPVADDVALVQTPVPTPGPGEVLVRNAFLSVDPYMRGRMNDARSYAAPYALGEAMHGGAVGEVVESADPGLPVGSFVAHGLGWRTHAVVPARQALLIDPADGPLPRHLGVLGMPGLTAWVGLFDIGQVRPGEAVWVSAASGAVGSVVGQLARLHGCRVVGSAGGPDKCRYVVEELGFDACVDHRAGDLEGQLRAVLPDGLDVYFDNVGGAHLQAALALTNPFARLVECGMISGYDGSVEPVDNLGLIVARKLTVRGFIVGDHAARRPLFLAHVGGLLRSGRLRYDETVRVGIEQTFPAFRDLLQGGTQQGKLVVDVRG